MLSWRKGSLLPCPAPQPSPLKGRGSNLFPGGRGNYLNRREQGRRPVAEQRGTVGGPVLTEWFATADLHKLATYEKLGGYSALPKVVTSITAQQVIDEVKGSGRRGGGGAGFPTA